MATPFEGVMRKETRCTFSQAGGDVRPPGANSPGERTAARFRSRLWFVSLWQLTGIGGTHVLRNILISRMLSSRHVLSTPFQMR